MLGWHHRSRRTRHGRRSDHSWLAAPATRPLRFDPSLRTASELVAARAEHPATDLAEG